jgi:hypothetical protein
MDLRTYEERLRKLDMPVSMIVFLAALALFHLASLRGRWIMYGLLLAFVILVVIDRTLKARERTAQQLCDAGNGLRPSDQFRWFRLSVTGLQAAVLGATFAQIVLLMLPGL